jgi:hypothetical protein
MVLVQIVINDASVQYYNVNVFGRKRVKLIKIDYRYSAGGADKLVVIQSDQLRLPFSNYPYFVFCANTNHQISNIHSDIVFDDVVLDGSLNLRIVDYETGVAPPNLQFLVLLFEITDFDV